MLGGKRTSSKASFYVSITKSLVYYDSCHPDSQVTDFAMGFELSIKYSTSIFFFNVLSSPLSSYRLKSGSHSGKLKGNGPLEHLVFNGSTAVVKQCAEIILIRLGQSDAK